jgi:hypothetical protein
MHDVLLTFFKEWQMVKCFFLADSEENTFSHCEQLWDVTLECVLK